MIECPETATETEAVTAETEHENQKRQFSSTHLVLMNKIAGVFFVGLVAREMHFVDCAAHCAIIMFVSSFLFL